MYIDINDSKKRRDIKLVEKVKDAAGKVTTKTLYNFGSFCENLELYSATGRRLVKKIGQVVQDFARKQALNLNNISDKEYVSLLNEAVKTEESVSYNLGCLVLDKVLEQFNLKSFFDRLQKTTRRKYPLYDYFRMIIFRQIISPGSLENYYDEADIYKHFFTGTEFKKQDFYDFLTFFYEHREEFQRFLFKHTLKLLGPQEIYIVYYDGSNFFCEISKADPDHLDELNDKIEKGLRKYGHSKENRNNPIVGLGILSCPLGIPLFFTVFPGNEQEISHIQTDLNNFYSALIEEGETSRFLLCADAGNYSGDLIFRISGENKALADEELKENDAYIIGRGIGQVDAKTRDWALEKKGFTPLSVPKEDKPKENEPITFIKSRTVNVKMTVKLENGKTKRVEVRQKQIAIKSEKRRYRKHKTIEEKTKKAEQTVNSTTQTKNMLKKASSDYIKPYSKNPETGEIDFEVQAALDDEKIDKDIEQAGYFIITTSEIHWPDDEILHLYRHKNIAEEIFRELKDVLLARPMYVYTTEHIVAHLDLCVIALIILNTLRVVVHRESGCSFSAKKVQRNLRNLIASPLGKNAYRITGINECIIPMLNSFGISLPDPVMLFKDILKCFLM